MYGMLPIKEVIEILALIVAVAQLVFDFVEWLRRKKSK